MLAFRDTILNCVLGRSLHVLSFSTESITSRLPHIPSISDHHITSPHSMSCCFPLLSCFHALLQFRTYANEKKIGLSCPFVHIPRLVQVPLILSFHCSRIPRCLPFLVTRRKCYPLPTHLKVFQQVIFTESSTKTHDTQKPCAIFITSFFLHVNVVLHLHVHPELPSKIFAPN